MIKIKIEGGEENLYKEGVKIIDILKDLFPKNINDFVGAKVNGKLVDLSSFLNSDGEIKFLTFDDEEGLEIFRHSSAHILASAVVSLFPEAKPTIGPVVEEGFYYDFAFRPFTPQEISKIEEKMKEIISKNIPFKRIEISKKEAREIFKDNPFKLELIEEMKEGDISVYIQDDFVDLCRGPHIQHSGQIKSFKLIKLSGAYWRGDPKREQLQRIYGISFPLEEMLQDYLKRIEESGRRDHRRIGEALDLFSFHEEGRGFPFWHPKGMVIRNEIINYWKEIHEKYGYMEVQTPVILNKNLWERSGHYEHYRKNMYFTEIDENISAIKPMNCPGGLLIYRAKLHSYRELPLRIAELGLVHRHELSGVLHGLFRVRAFTQDDAHIYCTEEQLQEEIGNIIDMVFEIYKTFGFEDIIVELSTRPPKFIGDVKMWDVAENSLSVVLKKKAIPFKLNIGEGAFYGPKIDFHIKDCMARAWQCGTIQIDFSMPLRFEATYEGRDGTKKIPVMIHRAILGSLERFIGILIEHCEGKFPLWLSPLQVKVLPVSEKFTDYAEECIKRMKERKLRVEGDFRAETLSRKIRDAQLQKINYQCVVGAREMESESVSVRGRGEENLGSIKIDVFIDGCVKEIKERSLIPHWQRGKGG